MADDSEYTAPEETSEGPSGPDPAETGSEEQYGASPEDHLEDDDLDQDDGDKPGNPRHSKIRTMRDVNRLVPGVLTIHYIQRDVSLVMDGDAAIRTIATWHDRHELFTDPLHPVTASAINGWVGIDLEYVMGMMWMPALGDVEVQRLTIDPQP